MDNLILCHVAAVTRRYSSYNCLTSWDSYDKIPRVRVEYYVNENTFKERLQLYFIKNQRSSLRIRIADLIFKLLACVLYILRVITDTNPTYATCYSCMISNKSEFLASAELTEEEFQENPIINWEAILWVNRPTVLWAVQLILALVSLTEAVLLTYLGYKGNIWQQILSFHFILELITTIPFALTILWPPLRNLFIPIFLNCWLAKRSLENMFNDLHRAMQKSQSALSQQLTILSATLLCLVFTSVCGIQHFQRAGHRHLNLFQSTYYVVVTFSTVGYGDFVPDIWPSQLYMVIMICVALIVLPTQFEQLAFTWMERQKLGGSYSSHRAQSEKHVVVCSTTLHADTIMDFLNEFYAHPLLQDYYVVLLSPMELDTTMRMILQVPIWAQRVIYIQGSCLKDGDLARARMNEAEACFILAARNYADKTAADEHTILRSWAVKDFAPNVPQYVQIFRPEHKLHVKFAEHVVCEDEFKYALLANNCTCPGASTLVTLLLHTSRGQEGQQSPEEWHRLYGKCSGNEIYHIVLGDSRFFGEYENKSFTYASFHSHRKYGVALVGVRPAELPEFYEDTILLNPGPRHIMKKDDTCYYMSITKEENSAFVVNQNQQQQNLEANTQKETIKSTTSTSINGNSAATTTTATTTTIINTFSSITNTITNTVSTSSTYLSMNVNVSSPVTPVSSVCARVPNSPSYESGGAEMPILDNQQYSNCEFTKLHVPTIPTTANDNPTSVINSESKQNFKDTTVTSTDATYTSAATTTTGTIIPINASLAMNLCATSGPSFHSGLGNTLGIGMVTSTTTSNHLDVPQAGNPNLLSPDILNQRRGSRRPSILPVPDMFTSSSFSITGNEDGDEGDESDDEVEDDVPWRSPSEKIAFFPSIKSITELSQSSNMRFMQFRAHDKYALHLSKMEKREKERGSHISYMFRLPFAAGAVFSASMLDTLLYQAFVKDYVITFVRLLLGIDQAPGSGFLTSMRITKDDMWIRTYGRLYQKLCSTTCEIPIGIYRTQDTSNTEATHVSNTPEEKWGPFFAFGKHCVRLRPSYEEDTAITPDSTKGSNEVLRSVTYRPPAMSGPISQQTSSHPTHHHNKSTTCLGGCTERKESSVSTILFKKY
ncbi:potassium channel subfamily T member 1-like isoform X7 [Glossina fuscipes]|uniref:Potassium channel subfamily T member 1-like isoform X7 n=1 Tax=Glossina fuscipes TaxID=7396 RepID=A0A9C6DU31_9MUSC|nr:potassium channel subfamily T member 1-like isoform X7 [Glossina fuscipes]